MIPLNTGSGASDSPRMTAPARTRLLPGIPWWVLLVALPLPLAAVVPAVVAHRAVVSGTSHPGPAGLLGSLAVVRRLADLGVAVSIDDSGTGYSSLSHLRDLPVAELELDRSFTADLLTDGPTEAIVASTVALAHRLGLRVVAEGVERAETLVHLAGLGCHESQGYLHSAPLPADRLEA